MTRMEVPCCPLPCYPAEEMIRIEALLANFIRCIANIQVKTLTQEVSLETSEREWKQLATRCNHLEHIQQEILRKMTRLEHKFIS